MRLTPESVPATHLTAQRRAALWKLGLCLLTTLTLGCGAEAYQQRLAETSEYFEYKDRVNQDLGSEWSGFGINLRVPAQFSVVAPPVSPTNDDGTVNEESTEDHRQPHYLGIELPGLVAAWKANVNADETGSAQGQTAYLYLLSNYDRYLQTADGLGSSADPMSFLADVESQVAAAIGVFLPVGETGSGAQKNTRYVEKIPAGLPNSKFRPSQNFTGVTFSPEIPVSDVPLEMQLYGWRGSKMQIALLMVYPASVSPREDLQQRLKLAMETFVASDEPPRLSSSTPGASGPAARGPAGNF